MIGLREIGRGLIAGLLWLGGLFALDLWDSLRHINRSIGHLGASGEAAAALQAGVQSYVVQVGTGYVVLGLAAGLVLTPLVAATSPRPMGRARWWGTAAMIAVVATAIGTARQVITVPALHDWLSSRDAWADGVDPWMVDAAAAGMAAVIVAGLWWRWGAAGASRGPLVRRLLAAAALAVGLAAALQATPDSGAPKDNEGLNVVLIGVDALRPDHLSGLGYARETSPNIDALLAESAVFTSAWTAFARTYPAWVTMLSGAWPTTHGIRGNLPAPEALVPDLPLLPQRLQAAGYTTAFTSDDSRFSYMVPELGFDRIVQPPVSLQNFAISVNEPRFRAFHAWMTGWLGQRLVPVLAHNQAFGKSYRPDRYVDRAADLLAEVSHADRFLFAVHSCVLHAPGDRVFPWTRLFGQQGYKGPNRFRYGGSGTALVDGADEATQRRVEVREQDVRIYDSGVAMADALVARIMGDLRSSGLLDHTVVVLFSDHGEELWAEDPPYDYYGPNHGFHVFGDGQHRVTMAIRFPDGAHAGEQVDAQVRLMDLTPTIAALTGVDGMTAPDAVSLLPLLDGEAEAGPRPLYFESGVTEKRYWSKGHISYPAAYSRLASRYDLDAETGRVFVKRDFLPRLIAAKDRAVQSGPWKLVWRPTKRGPDVALYDRRADPDNRHDVLDAHPDEAAALSAALSPFLAADGIDWPPSAEEEPR